MPFADQIDVFYGRVTHSSAQIYVRVSALAGGGEWSISGQVRGPIAPGTRTLPTTVALNDLGEGSTLLGTCAIPDPTFWTTQLPGVYEVKVELRREGKVVESVERSLGIRFFGASGRNFRWEGKRWVLRGVASKVTDIEEIDDFTDNAGVLVVAQPSDSLLSDASQKGVILAVEVATGDLIQELRRLSHWPAVAVVILPSNCDIGSELRAAAPNLLFAARVDPDMQAKAVFDWAEAVFWNAANVEAAVAMANSCPRPIVIERRLNKRYTLLEARAECDRLQRDLASIGDFAGYVVQN